MTETELDAAYTALAQAATRVGTERANLFLATLALALIARQSDAAAVTELIAQAERLAKT